MEYTFIIYQLDCIPNNGELQKIVQNIHWSYVLTDNDDNFVKTYGMTSLELPNEYFTPFEELTEQKVIDWLYQKVNIEELNNKLINELDLKKNPPIINLKPPWLP